MRALTFIRIGDKLIHRERVIRTLDEILALREQGCSQQEVAKRLGIDRSLVSRLESLGEVRKGASIAIVGFPIANKEQILQVAAEEGVDYTFLLTNQERWEFLERPGTDLFSDIMALSAEIRKHHAVVILGANRPAQFMQALLAREVIVVQVEQIAGTEGRFDGEGLRRVIRTLKSS